MGFAEAASSNLMPIRLETVLADSELTKKLDTEKTTNILWDFREITLLRISRGGEWNTISTCREIPRIGRKSTEIEILEKLGALHWRE